MSAFLLSQVLVSIAIVFDLLSFQLKDRRKIVGCLCMAGVLISSHFALLEQWTAAGLMAIATVRYFISIFSTKGILKWGFVCTSIGLSLVTYSGIASVLSCFGSCLQTIGAFQANDRRLREFMQVGTSFWLVHNYIVGSPTAVVMELLFILSNLIGYFRYYVKSRATIG
ncbi:YgjV family protein [Ferrimonas marina]|uniref:Inner membrane protein n=1 Tax=Ferrimonas marina TaxID=299255 RepID=A0A1M5RBE9_9GAMM|nr:YgjV family protein [Ferrimonas marina]SHH23677.1 inner membrane protein [Ferrimonas marina]